MKVSIALWVPRSPRFVFTEEARVQIKELLLPSHKQTDLGKQHLADTLRCANIEPGTVTEKNIRSMDNEREEHKKRKATVEFKKQRRKNYLKKSQDINRSSTGRKYLMKAELL